MVFNGVYRFEVATVQTGTEKGTVSSNMAIPFVSFCQVEVDEGGGNFQIVSWSQVGCVRQAETGS